MGSAILEFGRLLVIQGTLDLWIPCVHMYGTNLKVTRRQRNPGRLPDVLTYCPNIGHVYPSGHISLATMRHTFFLSYLYLAFRLRASCFSRPASPRKMSISMNGPRVPEDLVFPDACIGTDSRGPKALPACKCLPKRLSVYVPTASQDPDQIDSMLSKFRSHLSLGTSMA